MQVLKKEYCSPFSLSHTFSVLITGYPFQLIEMCLMVIICAVKRFSNRKIALILSLEISFFPSLIKGLPGMLLWLLHCSFCHLISDFSISKNILNDIGEFQACSSVSPGTVQLLFWSVEFYVLVTEIICTSFGFSKLFYGQLFFQPKHSQCPLLEYMVISSVFSLFFLYYRLCYLATSSYICQFKSSKNNTNLNNSFL